MKKMKCVHPRKAKRIMQEFICIAAADDIELKHGYTFQATCSDKLIEYHFDGLCDKGMKYFRAHWTAKSPMLKGFADVTITLLHEIGHVETDAEIRKTFDYGMRMLAWAAIDARYDSIKEKNEQYFEMPDEKTASEWGIEWLSNPKNRKIAKRFEKKFFACFE